MKFRLFVLLAVAAIGGANGTEQESTRAMADVRLMTLDPGAFPCRAYPEGNVSRRGGAQ